MNNSKIFKIYVFSRSFIAGANLPVWAINTSANAALQVHLINYLNLIIMV